MCGRFFLTDDPGVVARRFGAPPYQGGGRTPRYNVAPTQSIVVVTDDGTRTLVEARWGLVPSWAKDLSFGSRCINAQAETLAEKPAFRSAYRRRRCLIPANGFFEWPTIRGRKQPIRLNLKDGSLFSFAGLWETWQAPDGAEVRTCTIITCPPNALMAQFHHRMPVILTPEAEQRWLDPAITDPAQLAPLLVPYPAEQMVAVPVGALVNNATNDSPDCLIPLPGFEALLAPQSATA